LQPVIPPQIPLESILWDITGRIAPAQPQGLSPLPRKRRRVQRSRTSDASSADHGPAAEETPAAPGTSMAAEAQPLAACPAGQPSALPTSPTPMPTRIGYFKAQILRAEEDILPLAKRPEISEQDYRTIGTDLVAIGQKIGRTSNRPRLEWLIESLRSVLEQRTSLVPAYVGSGGQALSLYSHAATMAAIATSLWQWHEKTGSLPGPEQKPLSLTAIQIDGVDEFLCRPAVSEASSHVYRGRAALVRLVTRLLGDVLLRDLGLFSVNRLWEADDSLTILSDAENATTEAIRQFARQQGQNLFAQSGGTLRLVVAEPVLVTSAQLKDHWGEIAAAIQANLATAASRPAAERLQEGGLWREEAAVLVLQDRHGGTQEPGEWTRLAEAYERQLGMNLARGKTIAAYNSPVSPAGSEGEPTPIGPWFVHVGASAEGLVGWEGLEQVYSIGEPEEPWAWVPPWPHVPHGPTFRRADESQLRADPAPQRPGSPSRRREMPMQFEEIGWLARRNRKGRGFVGRSWLACLKLEADEVLPDCGRLVGSCRTLGQAVEASRQGQWFWQEFLDRQLCRPDRATWRVFVLRSTQGQATLIGPWNTILVLAGRVEQWWHRWIGSTTAWAVRGAIVFGARDVPVADLAWLAEQPLSEADAMEGAARIWVLDRARAWTSYRDALRLANLLDEQMQSPALLEQDRGLTFCRRLLRHEQQAHAVAGNGQVKPLGAGAAWRAELARDVRKLLIAQMPRRGDRTAGQDELLQQLQDLITAGRRGRLPGTVGIAARVALWQNQGETS
jgi:hypothetical protein